MKNFLVLVLLLFAVETFAWGETFIGEDLIQLKKIASECPNAPAAEGMTDDQLKEIVRTKLLIYIRSLKGDQEKYSDLQKKYEELGKELENAKLAREHAEAEARNRYIVLSIIAYATLFIGIVLIVGFFYLSRRRGGGVGNSTYAAHQVCPRCGWKHSPEELVCKNCNTHF